MIKHILVLGVLVVFAPLAQASNLFEVTGSTTAESDPKPFKGFLERYDEFIEKKYIDEEDFWQSRPNSGKLQGVLENISNINKSTDGEIENIYNIDFPPQDESIGSGRYIEFHNVRISSVIEKWEDNKSGGVVPIPAAAWLFLSSLGLLVLVRRRALGANEAAV